MKIRIQIVCFIICVFLFFATPADAQTTTPHFGMDVSTMFGTSWSAGSMFSQSIAPRFSYDLTKDFQFVAGTIFSTTRFSGMSNEASFFTGGQPLYGYDGARMLSSTVYAFGVYRVNPRLSITGGTWFETSFTDNHEGFMNPYSLQQNPRGMTLGLDYRINDNARFGLEVSATSGYSPFYPTFFHHSPFHGNFNSYRRFHQQGRW